MFTVPAAKPRRRVHAVQRGWAARDFFASKCIGSSLNKQARFQMILGKKPERKETLYLENNVESHGLNKFVEILSSMALKNHLLLMSWKTKIHTNLCKPGESTLFLRYNVSFLSGFPQD